MPYRKLPDTDASISTALRMAHEKAKSVGRDLLAFTPATLQVLQDFYPKYEKEVGERSAAL